MEKKSSAASDTIGVVFSIFAFIVIGWVLLLSACAPFPEQGTSWYTTSTQPLYWEGDVIVIADKTKATILEPAKFTHGGWLYLVLGTNRDGTTVQRRRISQVGIMGRYR